MSTYDQVHSSPQAVWTPPAPAFFVGRWQPCARSFVVHDNEDASVVGEVGDASAAEVGLAVSSLADAVLTNEWPLWRRREALHRASELVLERRQLFVDLLVREGTKVVRDATKEVARAAETLRLSAEQAGRLEGQTLPFADTPRGDGRMGWFTREPVGVVAAITPFNDPLNLVAHKVGPALIAGNAVAVKPSQQTPLTALALAEVLLESGVPGDRLAVLPGRGADAGRALVSHPLVDMVSFTGGWEAGNAVAGAAGAKKTLMELGGNGAVVVLEDADLPRAARAIVNGAFGNAGQNCLSVQRVYVAAERAAELLDLVVTGTEQLVVGSKADPRSDVGPLVDDAAADRVERWVAEAVAAGAAVQVGAKRDGTFFWPTVLTGVPDDAQVKTEEVFGPVVSIESFETEDQAVAAANRSDYALQAGVFTRDLDVALDVAQRLRFGAVMINDTGDFRIDAMPFGGGKRSGVGREGVPFAVDAMTEPKIIAIHRRRR
jgi:acyl-CoA reductase-like NAD-dependent aldehyde dehydrogenase